MAITPIIIGEFYPKSNLNELHFMIIYLCIKFESNTLIFSKATELKPFLLSMDRTDRTDVHTDSGDTVMHPH